MLRRFTTIAGICCAVAAIGPNPALAGSPPAIADCSAHGRLTQQYSVTQLHTALSEMPADVQEYTNCYEVIQHALLAQIGSNKTVASPSTSSSGGSSISTPVVVAIVVLALGGATATALAI